MHANADGHLYLVHHGIKGQKWGVRRFQNRDGSLTSLGKDRYRDEASESSKQTDGQRSFKEQASEFYSKHEKEIKIGLAVAGTSLAIYGAYKLYQNSPMREYGAMTYAKSVPLSDTLNDYSDVVPDIPVGTAFHRISRDAIADYTDAGTAYVSYKMRDNASYVAAGQNKFSFPGGERNYLHVLSSSDKVKVPSAREMAKLYLQENPNATDQQFRYTVTQGFIQWDKETIADDPVIRATAKKATQFRSALLAKGYSAIVDIEDAGGAAEVPLILLEPSKMSANARSITSPERVVARILSRK